MKLPKHHYIPVFYLKQWAGPNGKITAFRRPHGDRVVATPKPPTHTGYDRGLYWMEGMKDPDASNRIETVVMGRIDHNAAIAHQYIMRDDMKNIPPEIRLAWTKFLIGLLIRSPANINNVYKKMGNPSASERKQIAHMLGKGQRYEDISDVDMRRFALYTMAKLTQSPKVEAVLNKMHWMMYDLGLPELRFFISDRPIIMTNGLGRKGSHLAIPVSPRKLFLAFGDDDIRRETMGRSPWDIVDTVNNRVIRCAMEMAWDTNSRRLAYVQEHLSAESADDRDFFAGLK
jgi:Protein of unknown function (DUF4238)